MPPQRAYIAPATFFLLFLSLFWTCTPTVPYYETYQLPASVFGAAIEEEPIPSTYGRRQEDNLDYLPDTLYPEQMPRKDLLVSFHFLNTQDTFYRQYEEGTVKKYLDGLLYSANEDLKTNRKNWLDPPGIDNPVYPLRYKMFLAKKPGTNEPAIYHHYDDELYYYIFRGPKRNLGDNRVVRKYGVQLDSVLNIFVMPPHRDSLNSPNFKGNELTGVFLGNSIKLAGFYPKRLSPWEHRGNLNHEVGHALGLNHAWVRNDGCDDTRVHANNCWSRSQSAHCDTMTSNNVMDYSALQVAWTPCQVARILSRLNDPESRQRRWVKRTWCEPYEKTKIIVKENAYWGGGRDFRRDIIVKQGVTLTINGRVHLSRGQTITVEPGAVLNLGPEALLHNDCGDEWGGIIAGTEGRIKGEVIVDPAARVENLPQ